MTEKYEQLMANLPLKEDVVELLRDGLITIDEYDELLAANVRAQRDRREGPLSQDIGFTLVDD